MLEKMSAFLKFAEILADMKKYFLLLSAIASIALAGCAKEDEKNPGQSEIVISLKEVGENTAVINCVYNPDKSEMYQLSLGGVPYLNNRTKSGTMRIENLQSGMDYKVVAISYDVNCNPVDSSEVNFKTAGVIEDRVPAGNMLSVGTSIWDEEEYNNCPIKVSVKKMTDEIAKVTCEFTAGDMASFYSLECINWFTKIPEGKFNETGMFGEGTKSFLLMGLQSGLTGHYTLFAYYHGPDGCRTGEYASFDFSICFR